VKLGRRFREEYTMTTGFASSPGATAAHDDVQRFLADYFEAVELHDLPAFLSCFCEGEGVTLFENDQTYDWKGFVEFAEGFFQEVSEIECALERCLVDLLNPHAAVAAGVFTANGKTVSGEPVAVRNAFTFVLVKHGDCWKVKHAHESSLAP
jgi:ketosteroid isomerase-like protein